MFGRSDRMQSTARNLSPRSAGRSPVSVCAQDLRSSAAGLSASPHQPQPHPQATSAAGAGSQLGEASSAAVATAQQRGTEATGGGASAAAGATAAQQLSQGHQQSWSAVPGVAKALGLAGAQNHHAATVGWCPPAAAFLCSCSAVQVQM